MRGKGGGEGGREGQQGGRERVYVCLPLCVTGRTGLMKFIGMHVTCSRFDILFYQIHSLFDLKP